MSWVTDITEAIRAVYDRFVLRDIAYVVSGLLIISVPMTAHELWSLAGRNLALSLPPLLAGGYFVGLMIQEAFIVLGAMRIYAECSFFWRYRRFVDLEATSIRRQAHLPQARSDLLNRTITLKHMTGTTASAVVTALALIWIYKRLGLLFEG